MDIKRRVVYASLLSIVAFIIVINCTSSNNSSPPKNNVPASIENDAQRLVADLSAQGYEVTRGYFKLYTQDDCAYSYSQMKTCYGNNPAAPYITLAVQPWPEEFVDPATNLSFGQMYPGYSSIFRFDPREAIVIFGLLPPPAAYFGLQTYLFTREGTFDKTSKTYEYMANNLAMLNTFFTTVPLNPKRIQLAASLSNSNNNVVVQQQSGGAFNQKRFFITTPDQFMDNAVRQSLSRIAVSNTMIFTEPIPSVAGSLSAVRTGLDEHADDLFWIMRYAMPLDDGGPGFPSYTWKKDLPLVVLRVRDKRPARPIQPYGPVAYETRKVVDESSLQTDIENLVAEVNKKCARLACSAQETITFTDLQKPPINFVGKPCMEIGMNCLGDSQDTSYQAALGSQLSLDNGEIYAMAGTIGTATGKATYVGLSVNDSLMVKGLANISGDQLVDTAVTYTGANNTDKLYVYYFSRDCSDIQDLTEGNCLSISEEMIPRCTDPTMKTCDYIKLAERNYIVPGTRRGPDSIYILPPRLIKLNRTKR